MPFYEGGISRLLARIIDYYLIREVQTAHQILEARMGPHAVICLKYFQINQSMIALFVCPFQPRNCLFNLTQSGIDHCKNGRRDIFLF